MLGMEKDKIQIRISYDNMAAYMKLAIPDEENPYTMEMLLTALERKGVVAGIDREKLVSILENKLYTREEQVAAGKAPIEGHDGFYEFKFNKDLNRKPKVLPDGSVDYFSMNIIAVVNEDDVIALYNNCEQGEDGYNVKGATIAAKRCKELSPLKGKGFRRSEDGQVYYANETGKIDFVGDRLIISPVYEVSGDTDIHTGNIDFAGDVLIHGAVRTGMSIRAKGTVTIEGVVENATIEAGHDVILKSGLMGNSVASITTKGNLYAKFVEYANLNVAGFVNAEVLLGCNVECGKKIIITGTKGYLIGGNTVAIGGIEANDIGNEMEVKTNIEVGVDSKWYRRLKILERKIATTTHNIELLDEKIREIDHINSQKTLIEKPKSDPRKVSLLRMKIRESSTLQIDREERDEINEIVERAEGAKVVVHGEVHPGTMIKIDEIHHEVKDVQYSVEFIKYTDKIRMERLEELAWLES